MVLSGESLLTMQSAQASRRARGICYLWNGHQIARSWHNRQTLAELQSARATGTPIASNLAASGGIEGGMCAKTRANPFNRLWRFFAISDKAVTE